MLTQLSIRDIVLIERLDIEFSAGLSVLTGETGAGKSILLDSLSLALGSRGDASLVRLGAEQGQVTAVFDVPAGHVARDLLRRNGYEDDGDIIMRRLQAKDGRSRGFVNDQAASAGFMREVGRTLVEIHGQHDDRALIDIDIHRFLLDCFGNLGIERSRVANLYHEWQLKEKRLIIHRQKLDESLRELDYLRAAVEELDKLDPGFGEEDELSERRSSMMKAEKIATEISEAEATLSDSNSPIPVLAHLVRRLERKAGEFPELIDPVIHSLDEALRALDNARSEIDTAMRAIQFDPHDLESVEERLFALRGAARKYQVMVEELPALRTKMDAELAAIDASETALEQLENEAIEARQAYDTIAAELSLKRHNTAQQLKSAVELELPALKLERAEFIIQISSLTEARTADGIDKVEFWVKTNPGTQAGPLLKVASGGELSRFLLALKVALADRGSAPTLVFDEIDTGVGGAVADAIGQRLAHLAKRVQVLSVTHAPQVAARAQTHFLISKATTEDGERIATRIHRMSSTERAEEIARMLAGSEITSEARAAARRLLDAES